MTHRRILIAGTHSGVGKTTITLGLLAALRARGRRVQPFKVGPDFIDPGFHEMVTGRPSYNLDGWMCGREHVLDTVAHNAADADLALVEGVMGCFDGVDGTSEFEPILRRRGAVTCKWARRPFRSHRRPF